jgi:mono/diheme cytochrome c family protein
LPAAVKAKLWITAGVMLIPIGMVYASWDSTTTQPRVHLVKDMDKQDRFHAQGQTPLFADGRMSRAQVQGTVAEGQYFEDESFVTGKSGEDYLTAMPAGIEVDDAMLARGQKQFEIYCGLCHGNTGAGDGSIHERASSLAAQGLAVWVQPTDLNSKRIMGMEDGKIFETITNGLGTMPAYAAQISPQDRWAIIAYTRALQTEYGVAGPSAEELAAMTPVDRGKLVHDQQGCVACHVSAGAGTLAPSFEGLIGSSITLASGETITVDLAYVTESLRDPMAKANSVMPIPGMVMTPFTQLTDEEIADLFEYLSTLK